MTTEEVFGRLRILTERDDVDIQLVLGARPMEQAYDHRKVDTVNAIADEFLEACRKAVTARDASLQPVPFQPGESPGDARIVYLEPGEVEGVDIAVQSTEPVQNLPWFTGDEDFLRRMKYYVIRVSRGNQRAYFFHRASSKQELVRKGIVAKLAGHRFSAVDERLFLFDERVDFVVFEGYTFFFTYQPFTQIFAEDIRAAFAAKAGPVFTVLRTKLAMTNADEFETVCREDSRLSGALIRIHQKGGLGNLTMDWVLTKNSALRTHKLATARRPDGSMAITFEGAPTKRFILSKILEEKVNTGELTGETWVTGSHVPG